MDGVTAGDSAWVRVVDGTAVRRMTAADLPAVVAIETEAFSTPWQLDTFEGLLDRDALELLVLAGGAESAAESESAAEVLGYAVLWCVMDQGELANIAVRPELRGRGLGARLLEEVVAVSRRRGVTKLYLEVRDSNDGALRLYERFGFREVGRRTSYYKEPREDARVMALDLD